MGKDPAFLFYSSDFLTGTMTMTNEQVGIYIRLLCLQHQQGRLTEKHMLYICGTYDKDVFDKFKKDEQGLYYNHRLEEETEKRVKFCESRRLSRQIGVEKAKNKKDISNTSDVRQSYVGHTENENEDINDNESNSNTNTKIPQKEIDEFFNTIWKLYPKKEGKGSVSDSQKRVLYKLGLETMTKCIERYLEAKADKDLQFIKMGSTFFNSGYVDYLDENYQKQEELPTNTKGGMKIC